VENFEKYGGPGGRWNNTHGEVFPLWAQVIYIYQKGGDVTFKGGKH